MPTLTRVAALLLFAAFTYFLGLRYLLLFDDPPDTPVGGVFLSLVAAYAGWSFVGPRIVPSYLRSFTVVVQGYIVTLLLALLLYGGYDAFTQGYAQRYKDFGDVFEGVVGAAIEHLQRMSDIGFLGLLFGVAVVITLILTTVFRIAEARRLAR